MKLFIGCLLISITWGCSTIDKALPDYRTDYKESKITQPLEVPPNLLESTLTEEQMTLPADIPETTFSDYDKDADKTNIAKVNVEQVLSTSETVQIKRKDNVRWLVFNDKPTVIWSKIKQFWLQSGFELKIDDPTIGIMETEWKENRADIPQDIIRKYFGKYIDNFYSASSRDKFRIRLEQVDDTTELYLTHKGVEEVVQGEALTWQSRPSDSELEIEMLKRILVFTGVEQKPTETLIVAEEKGIEVVEAVVETTAKPTKFAELVTKDSEQFSMIIQENFAQAWRRVGLALDRLGFTVEDRDRTSGVYFIRYIVTEIDDGFFSGWFGDEKTENEMEYLINLLDESTKTRVIILDNNNKPVSDATSKRILTLLHESIVEHHAI
ncbi:outer membrane protein assembly factor BamC [Candidatus Halobeggiatoa sp. HSG11]|nr:outer membrane protein assembly factor BamC [Candidatus Halobeggiatoa sp. HSG11]